MAVVSSYSTLLTAVADYLARSNLTSFVPNYVQNFEEKFLRQPRNFGKWMESSLNAAVSTTAACPTDFLALKIAYLDGQPRPPLNVYSIEQLYQAYPRGSGGGTPRFIARNGANFEFGPVPSGTFTLLGTYYAKPTLLRSYASDAAAHWLIVNAPDLLLYGALLEAMPFIKNDDRLPMWQQLYADALRDYRDLMKAQNTSGGALQTLVA